MTEDPDLEDAIAPGPVVLVDTYLPRPGRREEFLALLAGDTRRLRAEAERAGWRGNRIYRSHDGEAVVVVTAFDSLQAKADWTRSEAFADHLRRIDPLLEHSLSRTCSPVAGAGEIDIEETASMPARLS
ncbi:antibiotic biosynthesis monooxygenase family protein [Luteimonas aquatica]|uniref:antibiotic biosynthesis monooxygenase family protein n=1 Tax=Luteimonas aquatica TaxID=450364 RepID=UPI001F5689E1|nr:antibiotic biosynthesis monooxygenase family protein [Luteimonas aquatica]